MAAETVYNIRTSRMLLGEFCAIIDNIVDRNP